jgi:protein SCO1/2
MLQKLSKRQGILVVVGLLILTVLTYGVYRVVAAGTNHEFTGTMIDNLEPVVGAELVRTGGETVTFPDAWQGKTLLVFFGYANCPDVCPLTMAELAKIYRSLGEPEDLQVVMVTVDPSRDTPERIEQYVKGFHPDFVGLSGEPEAITKAASAFYATSVEQGDGAVAHNSHVTLVDRQGRMRLIYNQDNVPKMTEDLQYVLSRDDW